MAEGQSTGEYTISTDGVSSFPETYEVGSYDDKVVEVGKNDTTTVILRTRGRVTCTGSGTRLQLVDGTRVGIVTHDFMGYPRHPERLSELLAPYKGRVTEIQALIAATNNFEQRGQDDADGLADVITTFGQENNLSHPPVIKSVTIDPFEWQKKTKADVLERGFVINTNEYFHEYKRTESKYDPQIELTIHPSSSMIVDQLKINAYPEFDIPIHK